MRKVFLALLGGAIVYEIVALANRRPGDTISEIVWDATTKRPLIPFACGALMGHFFWQRVQDADGLSTVPEVPSVARDCAAARGAVVC